MLTVCTRNYILNVNIYFCLSATFILIVVLPISLYCKWVVLLSSYCIFNIFYQNFVSGSNFPFSYFISTEIQHISVTFIESCCHDDHTDINTNRRQADWLCCLMAAADAESLFCFSILTQKNKRCVCVFVVFSRCFVFFIHTVILLAVSYNYQLVSLISTDC